jgi:two-component system, NarL family, response regulator NreC
MSRVLIVDDHAVIRRGVQSILDSCPGCEFCGEADNGADAIRLSETLKPEVIIMDISMPGLNGIEATRTIHKNHPETKVILLTLHENSEIVRSAFRAGARGYLLKGDAEEELRTALAEVLRDGSYISPRIDRRVINSVMGEMESGDGSLSSNRPLSAGAAKNRESRS